MFNLSALRSAVTDMHAPRQVSLRHLKQGQIVKGEIIQQFGDGTAHIQIGKLKVLATVREQAQEQQTYWFRVEDTNEKLLLSVIDEKAPQEKQMSKPDVLLRSLGLKPTATMLQIVNKFEAEGLPFTKELLVNGARFLEEISNKESGIKALQLIAQKNLPLTQDIFLALVAYDDAEPLSAQLERLVQALQELPTKRPLHYLLAQSIAALTEIETNVTNKGVAAPITQQINNQNQPSAQALPVSDKDAEEEHNIVQPRKNDPPLSVNPEQTPRASVDFTSGRQTFDYFMKAISFLGLQYEKDILNERQQAALSLKALLLKALQLADMPRSVREQIQHLLLRITGQQLVNMEDSEGIQQYTLQIPVMLEEEPFDCVIQWHGKKTKAGAIDPNHCRIIFHLYVKALQEVVVDVQIQNRVVHMKIYNDHPLLQEVSFLFQNQLKKDLKRHNYTLSAIKIVDTVANTNTMRPTKQKPLRQSYGGVDVRV